MIFFVIIIIYSNAVSEDDTQECLLHNY